MSQTPLQVADLRAPLVLAQVPDNIRYLSQ